MVYERNTENALVELFLQVLNILNKMMIMKIIMLRLLIHLQNSSYNSHAFSLYLLFELCIISRSSFASSILPVRR